MDTIVQTLEKLLGYAPYGFEWLPYVIGSIIVIIGFSTFCNLLAFILRIISPRRY